MKLVAVLLALAGCGDNLEVFAEPNTIELTFPSVANRELDLLVVMDDTIGLPEVQADMAIRLPEFLARLSVLEGQLPSLHIGMTTSDMGTTGSAAPDAPGPAIGQVGNGGCSGSGKDGALLMPSGGTGFLSDVIEGGMRVKNYQGELADALARLLRTAGGGGCGFEQHLRGMRRALTKPENAAFLRPTAALAILIVADEDDCSLRSADLLASETSLLGPLASFRCTREGVECAEPIGELGAKTHCRPREDSVHVEGIAPTIDFLEELKPPGHLVVTGIVGDPEPFVVRAATPPGGGTAVLGLDSVCSDALSGGVHPSSRLHALLSHFGGRGTSPSICGSDTNLQMLEVARTIKQLVGVVCLDSTQLTDSSTERGIQPACELTEIAGDTETRIRACPLADDCFEIVPDATACPETTDHLRLVVHRTSTPSAGAYLRARCETPGYP